MITAQQAWDIHYANATSDDPKVSAWNSPVYMASRNLFRAIVRTEYNLTVEQAERVYALMVENGDTVAWNIDILREEIPHLTAAEEAEVLVSQLNAREAYRVIHVETYRTFRIECAYQDSPLWVPVENVSMIHGEAAANAVCTDLRNTYGERWQFRAVAV